MFRLIPNRPPWRLWITTLVAASGIVLLLTGLRWQSSRHRITYFNPPERGDTGPERPPDHVDGVGSEPGQPTIKPTVSVPPKQPVAPVGQGNTNDYGLSVEDAANATLGVSRHDAPQRPPRSRQLLPSLKQSILIGPYSNSLLSS